MEAAIGLIGTIIGACIAGGFMHYKDSKNRVFEKEKDKKALLLSKYEEIYKDLSAYSGFANEISMQMISEAGFSGKFDSKDITYNLKNNNLKMNVMFYAPELAYKIAHIDEKYIIIIESMTNFLLKETTTPEEKVKLTGNATVASIELSRLVTNAQEELALLTKKLINA